MTKKVMLAQEDLDLLEKIFSTAFAVGVEKRDSELLAAHSVQKKLYAQLLAKNEQELEYAGGDQLYKELSRKLLWNEKKEET